MYSNGVSEWTWFLWVGFLFLMISGFGNWGYTYRLHRRVPPVAKGAVDILDERYARGEIAREEYGRMKSDIMAVPAEVR